MRIISATTSDRQILTQLTQQSKAYWGYSKEQMEKWTADLTLSPNYISENIVIKLIQQEEIVGYYALLHKEANTVELDNLFIHPSVIGKGYGSLLLQDAIERSIQLGYTSMVLYADPHATDFYLKKGFAIMGRLKTSIPNRYLPKMEKQL